MDAYAENLNKATDDGFEYYVVKPGETVYSLARRFEIPEQEFAAEEWFTAPLELQVGSLNFSMCNYFHACCGSIVDDHCVYSFLVDSYDCFHCYKRCFLAEKL